METPKLEKLREMYYANCGPCMWPLSELIQVSRPEDRAFPNFNKLPTELREIIWGYALLNPPQHMNLDIHEHAYHLPWLYEPLSRASRTCRHQAGLGTCRELRDLYLASLNKEGGDRFVFAKCAALESGYRRKFMQHVNSPPRDFYRRRVRCSQRPLVTQPSVDTYVVHMCQLADIRMHAFLTGLQELVPVLLESIQTIEIRDVSWPEVGRDPDEEWEIRWLCHMPGLRNICLTELERPYDSEHLCLNDVRESFEAEASQFAGPSRDLTVLLRYWADLQHEPIDFSSLSNVETSQTFTIRVGESARVEELSS